MSPSCTFDQSFSTCPSEQYGFIGCASTDALSDNYLHPYPLPLYVTIKFFSDKSMAENSEIENDQKDDSEEDEVEVEEQRDVLENDQKL